MSGSSSQQQQTQQTQSKTPWGPSGGLLSGVLKDLKGIDTNLSGTEQGALSGLLGNANFMNQNFGTQATGLANELLTGGQDRTGMVTDAYSQLQSDLGGTARGDYLDPNKNPWFSQVTNTIGNDVQKRLGGLYAGSGRDPSGAGSFGQNLGRGVAEGTAPVFSQMYDAERNRQLGAAQGLFGGAGSAAGLLSGLDQTALGNKQAGLGVAQQAGEISNSPYLQQLAVEAQKRGIPLSLLQQIAGIGLPIGDAFGTTNATGTQDTQKQMSGAEQFAMIAGGLGKLFGGSGSGGTGYPKV